MIKQYTFTTVAEHDAEYTDYRPNHIPAATCGYPYDLIYPTAYPTRTIVTVKCPQKNKDIQLGIYLFWGDIGNMVDPIKF